MNSKYPNQGSPSTCPTVKMPAKTLLKSSICHVTTSLVAAIRSLPHSVVLGKGKSRAVRSSRPPALTGGRFRFTGSEGSAGGPAAERWRRLGAAGVELGLATGADCGSDDGLLAVVVAETGD